jgi:hypothetical protein
MKLTTDNWRPIMNSKDSTRKALQLLDNIDPEDRLILIQRLARDAKDWEELERLTRPIRSEMTTRSRLSGKP